MKTLFFALFVSFLTISAHGFELQDDGKTDGSFKDQATKYLMLHASSVTLVGDVSEGETLNASVENIFNFFGNIFSGFMGDDDEPKEPTDIKDMSYDCTQTTAIGSCFIDLKHISGSTSHFTYSVSILNNLPAGIIGQRVYVKRTAAIPAKAAKK